MMKTTFRRLSIALFAVVLALPTFGFFSAGNESAFAEGTEWKIELYPNGAPGDPIDFFVEDGAECTLPECPFTREGYVFSGWIVSDPSDSLEIMAPSTVFVPKNHMYLYAVWELSGQVDGHSLTLLSNIPQCIILNGEPVCGAGSFVFKEGDSIVVTAEPTGEGVGLYSVEATGIEIEQTDSLEYLYDRGGDGVDERFPYPGIRFDMPDHDVVITIVYNYGLRTITFDANGGSGEMEQLVFRGDTLTLPDCAFTPPEGMVFDGWLLPFPGDPVAQPGVSFSFIALRLDIKAVWKDDPDYKPEPDNPETHTHDLVAVKATDPTCDAPGHETYWKCSGCGKLFADANGKQEISAPKEIAAVGHDWGEWTVTKEPTATQEGEKVRTCKRDSSHTETAAIPATGGEPEPHAVVDSGGTAPTWDPESGEGLTFTVKRAEDDADTYAHFTGVAVDGTTVPPLGYTAEEGSLILTLLPAYLESLREGSHDVSILFDDGTVTASFSIAGPGGVAPTSDPGRSGLPVWAWILIGVAGAAAVAFGVFVLLGRSKTAGRANPGGAVHRRR